MRTVSYTHLDVYKRQPQTITRFPLTLIMIARLRLKSRFYRIPSSVMTHRITVVTVYMVTILAS